MKKKLLCIQSVLCSKMFKCNSNAYILRLNYYTPLYKIRPRMKAYIIILVIPNISSMCHC